MFTGDLEKRVKTYPKFRGKEKHLLKAQIVRISFGTELTAAGKFKVNSFGFFIDLQTQIAKG